MFWCGKQLQIFHLAKTLLRLRWQLPILVGLWIANSWTNQIKPIGYTCIAALPGCSRIRKNQGGLQIFQQTWNLEWRWFSTNSIWFESRNSAGPVPCLHIFSGMEQWGKNQHKQLISIVSPGVSSQKCFQYDLPSILWSCFTRPASPRFVRRGRASRTKKDLDDGGQSGSDEIASDVHNVEDFREWLSLQSFSSRGLLPNQQLARKFLPPGKISDLYKHYRANQTMLGCHSVSYLTWHPIPRVFSVLWRVPVPFQVHYFHCCLQKTMEGRTSCSSGKNPCSHSVRFAGPRKPNWTAKRYLLMKN